MKIIKRNGEEAIFDIRKIVTAIEKANSAVPENERLSEGYIQAVATLLFYFQRIHNDKSPPSPQHLSPAPPPPRR